MNIGRSWHEQCPTLQLSLVGLTYISTAQVKYHSRITLCLVYDQKSHTMTIRSWLSTITTTNRTTTVLWSFVVDRRSAINSTAVYITVLVVDYHIDNQDRSGSTVLVSSPPVSFMDNCSLHYDHGHCQPGQMQPVPYRCGSIAFF